MTTWCFKHKPYGTTSKKCAASTWMRFSLIQHVTIRKPINTHHKVQNNVINILKCFRYDSLTQSFWQFQVCIFIYSHNITYYFQLVNIVEQSPFPHLQLQINWKHIFLNWLLVFSLTWLTAQYSWRLPDHPWRHQL